MGRVQTLMSAGRDNEHTNLSTSLTAMHSLFLSIVVLKGLEEDTATKVSGSVESDLLAD